ncbi:MAG: F0F1 ATP synthase subunit delta [Muribaculaceae bacterium]|nr:F0F1 ATP synthase subunit delta [Muribaculaceae bacterium]
MNDGLIPNRYAKALYKLAVERGDDATVYARMKQLDSSYAAEPQLKKAVANPFLDAADKTKLLLSAAGAGNDESTARFVPLVIKNNRVAFMRAIALSYIKLYRERNDIARVEVVTATAVASDVIDHIVDVVKNQLNGKTIELTQRVDPALIGGFTVNVDSMVLDASVKNQLEKLRLKLLS